MQPRTIPLTELVPLYRQMTDRQWSDNRLCGALHVSDLATVKLLSELLHEDNADNYPCLVEEGDEENIQIGDKLQLKFGRVRTGVGLLVPSLESLPSISNLILNVTQQSWYLIEEDEASWESKNVSTRLFTVEKLVRALEGTTSVLDERNRRLVFLQEKKLEVPLEFDSTSLLDFNLDTAEKIIAELELKDGHSEHRHEIFSTVICEMLSNIANNKRFSVMLTTLDELFQRFTDGYKLFASSFSFEKVRDQAEAIKLEYLGKIHKTFTDIQGQLLGIPISTVVVATQFKNVDSLTGTLRSSQLWINTAVMVGAFIFCLFFTLSVVNQKHTLDALEEEIKRHKRSLEDEHADIKNKLSSAFDTLEKRACFHKGGLYLVLFICWAAFLFGLSIFWILTKNAI